MKYVTGLNVTATVAGAYSEMKQVFEAYSKYKFSGTKLDQEGRKKNPVKLFHYIQSFEKGSIIPEEAHRLGVEWAKKMFGNDVQILISTHVDRAHTHNHIVINSYSLGGKKIYSNKDTLNRARNLSDEISLANGYNVIGEKRTERNKSKTYHEWNMDKKGVSWKSQIAKKIDELIVSPDVNSLDDMISQLVRDGFDVKRGKYLCIKAPGQERYSRTYNLGKGYAEEEIEVRIRNKESELLYNSSSDKAFKGIQELYVTRIREINILISSGKKSKRSYNIAKPYSITNDYDIYMISDSLRILNRDAITSEVALEQKKRSIAEKYKEMLSDYNTLTNRAEYFKKICYQVDTIRYLRGKEKLSKSETMRLDIAEKEIAQFGEITIDGLTALSQQAETYEKKAAALKNSIKETKLHLEEYERLQEIYSEIKQPDYISRLIEEEKKRLQEERGQKNV